MRVNRVKKCMGLGILLLITGCGKGVNTEPETSTQEEQQVEENLQAEADIQIEADSQPAELYVEDDDFYVQCLQNLYQGNSITYADGYYYYRSQTENYSLCRTKGTGMPVEIVADQVPGSIYVRGDKIYFRSVYDREYDPFYQLTEEPVEDDRYLYPMNLDGSGCELLLVIPKLCLKFVTDGEWLYYLVYEREGDEFVLYKSSLDGKEEEKILQKEDNIWDILPYQGDLYWVDGKWEQLVHLNAKGEEEVLASDVLHFTIARGQAYVINEEEIRRVDLTTGEECLLAERKKASGSGGQNKKDTYPWYSGSHDRGIFLVNGQVFARYYESETKGVLWHILDGETFVVFEDMEPLTAEELVLDTSLLYMDDIYYLGRTDENAEEYLGVDGDLYYEESFGTKEAGSVYGYFSITLPKFNAKLDSYEQLNQQMEELFKLALEDKDSFFQEMSELNQDNWISWRREHEYSHLYIGEKYISMHYARGGYEGGMRDWKQSMPLIFDRETGLMLHMDNLFTVEESVYMKRLTVLHLRFPMNGLRIFLSSRS